MISDNKKSYYKLSNFLTSKGACTTHPFHMVRCSPWPFVTSETLFVFVLALVNFFHFTKNSEWFVVITFIIFLIPIIFWFRDIIRESTYMGLYTVAVQKNLRIGMTLFIISEIMFFFSLF
jgi:hypothetical protein